MKVYCKNLDVNWLGIKIGLILIRETEIRVQLYLYCNDPIFVYSFQQYDKKKIESWENLLWQQGIFSELCHNRKSLVNKEFLL